MKKLLTYGLVLATLLSIGSVCFADIGSEINFLTFLRNQAIALLNDYDEERDEALGYSYREIADMIIGDLNEDGTVLIVNGERRMLPERVVKAIREYLAQRAELAPDTMGTEEPLFISCGALHRIRLCRPMNTSGIRRAILRFRRANG